MKVYIGDVVSVNSSDEVFRYLVEDAGRICYVGNHLPEKYASSKTVDLDGRDLLPVLDISRRLPRIGGCFEYDLDGCFGFHDAALHKPYSDPKGVGECSTFRIRS